MAISTAATVTGSGTSVSSISASSWTPSANDLILVWVACRSGVTVSSLSGNGITFAKVVEDLQSPQNQCTLSLWRGMSASPSTGQITATLSGTAIAAIMVAHRISGADTGGSNGSGAIGASAIANTGATDTNTPSVDITTTAANSRVYGGATHRQRTYTVGTGETSISINNSVGTAGDVTSLSTEYQDVASASTVTINGTLNSAFDWIQGAVEVKTASTTITGDASITLGAATVSADGSLALAGDASATLGAATLSAAGALEIQGAASITLGAATASAAGALAIAGDASITLGAVTLAADGGLTGIAGDAAITLGAATVVADGSLALAGAASIALGAATVSAAGTLALVGDAAITLGAVTLAATGEVTVPPAPWSRHVFAVPSEDRTTTTTLGASLSVPAEDRSSTTTLGASLTVASEDRTSYA